MCSNQEVQSTYRSYTVRTHSLANPDSRAAFFRWDISVICPEIVFSNLPFQTLWPNSLKFFKHFKKVSVYDQKMTKNVAPEPRSFKWGHTCGIVVSYLVTRMRKKTLADKLKYCASQPFKHDLHMRRLTSCMPRSFKLALLAFLMLQWRRSQGTVQHLSSPLFSHLLRHFIFVACAACLVNLRTLHLNPVTHTEPWRMTVFRSSSTPRWTSGQWARM